MKHLFPFVAGFVTFMIISSVYYMGLTEMPTGGCFAAETTGDVAEAET